jgi:hypothetical protein
VVCRDSDVGVFVVKLVELARMLADRHAAHERQAYLEALPTPRYAPGTVWLGSGDCGCGHCPSNIELWWQHAEWCEQSLDHSTARVARRKADELADSVGAGIRSILTSPLWPRLLSEERQRQEGSIEALKDMLYAKYGDLREQPVRSSEQEQSGSPPPQKAPPLPSPSLPQPSQHTQPQSRPQSFAIGQKTEVEERRRAALARERSARRGASLAKPLPKPGPSGPVSTPRSVAGAPLGAAKVARNARKEESITAMHHHKAALKEAEERRVRHLMWQNDMRNRGSRISRREVFTGVCVDTPPAVTLGDLMPSSMSFSTPCPEVATTSALPPVSSPPPSALPPPPPSLLPRPPTGWTAAPPAVPAQPPETLQGPPAPVLPTQVALQQIMVKVTHRSNTFCLAFGSEAELTWESLWLQVAGRFELLPGGEAMADAIYAGSAIFTYVDADGDSVQLVCEADLAIAVRSASVSSPPTLRLLVELARKGGSAGEADRSGSGEGGEGGAGGSGKPAPERYERCPQPWAPGPQPQGDGRSSPSGGGGMARGAAFDASGAPTVLCPQEQQWARADAQVLAERGYRRFRRPAAAARPSASAEQVAPMAPSLPQTSPLPGLGYVFSVIEVELSPAPWRCRQRGPRVHRRRRRGERWRWQCGFAPRAEGERAGVGRDNSELRHALQAYGEGPGRSRSGPISIHRYEGQPIPPRAAVGGEDARLPFMYTPTQVKWSLS